MFEEIGTHHSRVLYTGEDARTMLLPLWQELATLGTREGWQPEWEFDERDPKPPPLQWSEYLARVHDDEDLNRSIEALLEKAYSRHVEIFDPGPAAYFEHASRVRVAHLREARMINKILKELQLLEWPMQATGQETLRKVEETLAAIQSVIEAVDRFRKWERQRWEAATLWDRFRAWENVREQWGDEAAVPSLATTLDLVRTELARHKQRRLPPPRDPEEERIRDEIDVFVDRQAPYLADFWEMIRPLPREQ